MNATKRHRFKISIIQITSLAIFLGTWQEFIAFKILNPVLFPSPVKIVLNFFSVLSSSGVLGTIREGMLITLLAYAAAVVSGMIIGLCFGSSKFVRRVSEVYLVLFSSIPKMAFLPVFALALGVGFSYQFWFGFIAAVVPMALNTMFSVATVPDSLVKAARSMGASTGKVYLRVVIPSVMPTLLGTARLVFGSTFGGILIAEQFAGNTGFGYLVVRYTSVFAIVPLYVTIVAASLVGITAYLILLGVERHFTRWNINIR